MSLEQQIKDSNAFRSMFKALRSSHNCYLSEIIASRFNISDNLQINIHNYGDFIDTFEALVKKLYLWVEPRYSSLKMMHKWILPTCVFLHYLNVDISKIPEINLFVVNSETYELYRHDVGGEYSDTFKTNKAGRMHLILIKDYNDVRSTWKDKSLTSLFHELIHLVDNIDFNGLNDANNIDYTFRWHEIKARYISELFLCVYKGLKSDFTDYRKNLLNMMYVDILRDSLMGLKETIDNISSSNNEMINIEINSLHRSSDLISEFTIVNQSYYRSLKCINQINQMFNKVENISYK